MTETVVLLIILVITWVVERITQVAVGPTYTAVPQVGIGVWIIKIFRILFLGEAKI